MSSFMTNKVIELLDWIKMWGKTQRKRCLVALCKEHTTFRRNVSFFLSRVSLCLIHPHPSPHVHINSQIQQQKAPGEGRANAASERQAGQRLKQPNLRLSNQDSLFFLVASLLLPSSPFTCLHPPQSLIWSAVNSPSLWATVGSLC